MFFVSAAGTVVGASRFLRCRERAPYLFPHVLIALLALFSGIGWATQFASAVSGKTPTEEEFRQKQIEEHLKSLESWKPNNQQEE